GHEVLPVGVSSDLAVVRRAMDDFRPHITFNLLEEFHGITSYDQHVVAFLELLKKPYTGCNPRGLMLARDKALAKKVLSFHRIPVPRFHVFPMGRRLSKPRHLRLPAVVKSLTAEGSEGISRASLVHSEEKLFERAAFIHRHVGTDALAEQFIQGRELYVGVLGNQRLTTLPVWELRLENVPEDVPLIATSRLKWNPDYQKKVGYRLSRAKGLSPELEKNIARLSKRIYRRLGLSGYARLDYRLAEDGRVFLLEANPNPQISHDAEFALAAKHAGIAYPDLLRRILNLGLSYRAAWKGES
ncbi:MAG: ATP-grasp domain-containing protein, partial [Myxococcales bacterium]|nr:ATP-grasp domain-containing protein [Myxococcales bacterium]